MSVSRTQRRPGRPARLSRDAILAAALDIADRQGLEPLTMRAVAAALDAEAMSLYRHVANKDDLLDGMVDLVFAEIERPPAELGWKEALGRFATSTRAALVRHPWASAVMESRTSPGPANLGHHDAVLAVLMGAGFTGLTATRAYNIIDSYVFGFVLQETSLPVASPEAMAEAGPGLLELIPAGSFPHLARAGQELMATGFDYRAEFDAGLDLILDGIERRLAPAE